MTESTRQLDFHSMEPGLRAIALVGRYLQVFAFAEVEVDDAIAKILKLSSTQSFVLNANLPFGNKIHVLSTLVDISFLDKKQKEQYTHTLNLLLSFASRDRNTIAHVMFSESPKSDGVRFLVIKARGKFQAPDFDWSIDRFEQAFSALRQCRAKVVEMGDAITKLPTDLATLLAAVTTPPLPMEGSLGLGSLGFLSLQLPTDRTSATTSANPETEPRTPSPEKK